jgi:tight adherence protein B
VEQEVMNIQVLAVTFLAFIGVLGIVYVLLFPTLSGEAKAEKRQRAVSRSDKASRQSRAAEISKRDQVAQSLKDLEAKQKKSSSPPINIQIEQAGLDWNKRTFYVFSIIVGVGLAVAVYLTTKSSIAALAGLFVGTFGLPRWFLKRRKAKRLAAFAEEFANALDVIVRGVKAGLPLGDCLRIIANEAQEPVRGEFRIVVQTQALGIPMGEAVQRIYERMPCSEANFFAIVIAIQQKAGGNLSEALGNLSKVLRERKKMRAKIKAVSMEAKASAGIIGILPIAVMTMVYLTSPTYIEILWTTTPGYLMLAGCGFWMTCGVLIMKKMINFDF